MTSARSTERRTYPFAHVASVDAGTATIRAASVTVYSGSRNLVRSFVDKHLPRLFKQSAAPEGFAGGVVLRGRPSLGPADGSRANRPCFEFAPNSPLYERSFATVEGREERLELPVLR